MKRIFTSLTSVVILMASHLIVFSQPSIDLSQAKQNDEKISLGVTSITIKNRIPQRTYKLIFEVEKLQVPTLVEPFDVSGLKGASTDCEKCNKTVNDAINDLFNAASEKALGENIKKLQKDLNDKTDGCKVLCLMKLNDKIKATITEEKIDVKLENDQIITITVIAQDKDGKVVGTWTKKLITPKTSRWLTHYGLTYAPSIVSNPLRYYSKADTSVANRYTVTEQNNRSPKPWDNISATINFTYPFSANVRGISAGFTGGFGLNPGVQLSGHAGFSAIIGTNIIIGTGIVLMQKYNLKGEYSDGQIIKENLSFESLHEKLWRPEVYFTIGFRFNKNPFAGSSDKDKADASTAEAGKKKE